MNEIAIVDIETTGDNSSYDSIVEIGICKLNLDTGEITPLFDKICQEKNKPLRKDGWCFENTDLKYEEVVFAPDINEIRNDLQKIFDTYTVTAYNQRFDFTFLEDRGFKIPNKFWDPMFKCQYILKIMRYNGSYKWPSFQEAWNYFFLASDHKIKHRALEDAIAEAKIIYEIYKNENKEVKNNADTSEE